MSRLTRLLDESLYRGICRDWDDQIFRAKILETITPETVLLDIGAGSGRVEAMSFRGIARFVCGIDLDERVLTNSLLDEGRVGTAELLPYPDSTFDVVIADNVLEHLEHPSRVFAEVARVLKQGGIFLVKTPNLTHYMPLIASITPTTFHKFWNRFRGREEVDTFPTLYRANSPNKLKLLAGEANLEVLIIELFESRPEYLRMFAPLYLLGWIYEKVVNASPILAKFRVAMVGQLRKPLVCR